MFLGLSAYSSIWRVNNMPNSGADFTSLAAAIEAASPNDIIYIEGSGTTYNEGTVNLSKPLTIYGCGYFLTENANLQANHFAATLNISLTIDSGSEGTILSGLRIIGGMLYVYTSDITIERCYINVEFRLRAWNQDCSNFLLKQCYVGSGLWMWDMAFESSNIVIENNIFNDDLNLSKELGSYIVKNNIFYDYYDNIIVVNAVVQNNIVAGQMYADNTDNNLVENNILEVDILPVGGNNNIGNIDLADVFVDYPDGTNTSPDAMFELKSGSVAIGFGIGGIDCGIFDGDFPYILSGLPPLPRFYEADISTTGTSQGLRVSFKAKSQH